MHCGLPLHHADLCAQFTVGLRLCIPCWWWSCSGELLSWHSALKETQHKENTGEQMILAETTLLKPQKDEIRNYEWRRWVKFVDFGFLSCCLYDGVHSRLSIHIVLKSCSQQCWTHGQLLSSDRTRWKKPLMGKKGLMEAAAASLKVEMGECGTLLWGLLKEHEWQ